MKSGRPSQLQSHGQLDIAELCSEPRCLCGWFCCCLALSSLLFVVALFPLAWRLVLLRSGCSVSDCSNLWLVKSQARQRSGSSILLFVISLVHLARRLALQRCGNPKVSQSKLLNIQRSRRSLRVWRCSGVVCDWCFNCRALPMSRHALRTSDSAAARA